MFVGCHVAVLPFMGQTVNAQEVNVCDRTAAVCDAIVAATGVSNCADITVDHLGAITTLDLGYQQITSLQLGDFSNLSALDTLILWGNEQLRTLPSGLFSGLTALKLLDLEYNELTALPSGIFSGLTALKSLDLRRNELTALPSGLFSGLTALTSLDLRNNELTALPSGIFSGLTALTSLDLRHNELTALPSGLFSDLPADGTKLDTGVEDTFHKSRSKSASILWTRTVFNTTMGVCGHWLREPDEGTTFASSYLKSKKACSYAPVNTIDGRAENGLG